MKKLFASLALLVCMAFSVGAASQDYVPMTQQGFLLVNASNAP